MKLSYLNTYFALISLLLVTVAAIPEPKRLSTVFRTYLLNKVWPVVFVLIWVPLVPMVALKLYQFASKRDWEDVFDTMHMFLLGVNTLYYVVAVQRSSAKYKHVMNDVIKHFTTRNQISTSDFIQYIILWVIILNSFLFYIGGSIYYGDYLVPLWVPFVNNDDVHPSYVFFGIWIYELAAGCYMFVTYGFLSPFVVVITSIIVKELEYLARKTESLRFYDGIGEAKWRPTDYKPIKKTKDGIENLKTLISENESEFVRNFVQHHCIIKR